MSQASTGESVFSEIVIDATPERIFDALVVPEQRAAWWGAGGGIFRTERVESDARTGGKWSMRGMTGERPFEITGEYTEVDPPRTLAFTWAPSWCPEAAGSIVRFELIPQGSATLVRVTHSGLTPDAAKMHSGWANILGQLKGYINPG